jgi:hypothetical protein
MQKTIEEKATKLLKDLEVSKLKSVSNKTNILMQQQLQQLMLSYIVDIKEQTLLKQNDLASTYPLELISSLKIISDLYLKIKDINRSLPVTNEQCEDSDKYVF